MYFLEKQKILQPDPDNKYTYCNQFQENYQSPCDCWYSITTRCKIYPIFQNYCEKCGHSKKVHSTDNFYFAYTKEDSQNIINEIKYLTKEEFINDQKNNFQWLLNELNYNKLENKINNINKKRKLIIMKIQRLFKEVYKKGINKNHFKIENDYINSLIEQMKEIGYSEDKIKDNFKNIKKSNELIKKLIEIPLEEILMKYINELIDKFKITIYN